MTDRHHDITACLTMGRRPELLELTLKSLCPALKFMPVLAVNDFGDGETNEVFRHLCPQGVIVESKPGLGHHRVVDLMYERVRTDLIFHFEDWEFNRTDFFEDCVSVLDQDPSVSSVCARWIGDFLDGSKLNAARLIKRADGADTFDLSEVHDQWYGFTFNPSVYRKSIWSDIGGYTAFKKERHISRHLRGLGYNVRFLDNGACRHIGAENSVSSDPSLFQLLMGKFRRR